MSRASRHGSLVTPVAVYVERFRGNVDLAAEMRRMQAAADRLVDLLKGWMEREMKNELPQI
jgi:hypothetical protein